MASNLQVTSYFAKQFPFLKDHLLSVMLFLSLHFFFCSERRFAMSEQKVTSMPVI